MDDRKIERPDVFTYQNHRDFLKDWFAYMKKTERGFSLRRVAQESGLASGHLSMFLSGKRELSTKALTKLVSHLRLSNREARALELLHQVATSDSQRGRMQAIGQLTKQQEFSRKNHNDVEVYRYLTKWYYVAIREMVFLGDFKEDIEWLQGRLGNKVSQQECREALEFLLEKNFITKDESGHYTSTDKPLNCRDGVFKASLGEFHRQMMDLGAQAIEKVPRDARYILGHTFAITASDFARVREILDEAVNKLESLGQKAKAAEEVYHIELASFPLTRLKSPKKPEEGV